jgi:hypothetical protein
MNFGEVGTGLQSGSGLFFMWGLGVTLNIYYTMILVFYSSVFYSQCLNTE